MAPIDQIAEYDSPRQIQALQVLEVAPAPASHSNITRGR
jgi:hypothetical protein